MVIESTIKSGRITRRRMLLGGGLSLIFHCCALAALAYRSADADRRTATFAPDAGTFHYELRPSRASRSQPGEAQAHLAMLILPDRAQLAGRHYERVSSAQVPLSEMLSRETLDRLADAQRGANDERLALAEPAQIARTVAPQLPAAAVRESRRPHLARRAMSATQLASTSREAIAVALAEETAPVPVRGAAATVPSRGSRGGTAGVRTAPSFAGNRPPAYPDIARLNRWEGQVLLRLMVGADGKVTAVEIIRSSGHEVLDAAAVQAVRTWEGQPAFDDQGRPIESIETLPVRFRLR